MFGIHVWLLVGLSLGVAAKLITPRETDSGTLVRVLIGISGAGLGGLLSTAAGNHDVGSGVALATALVGAAAALLLNALSARHEQKHSRDRMPANARPARPRGGRERTPATTQLRGDRAEVDRP